MPLSSSQKDKILKLLRDKIQEKITKYRRESTSMPFMSCLIQDDELVASYSLMTSIATSLGQSIYERVAQIIAEESAEESKNGLRLGSTISPDRKSLIGSIINDLRQGKRSPDKKKESKEILRASNANGTYQKEGNVADFYMRRGNMEYYFEIKTVKPNIDVFTSAKRKMLEWVAIKDKMIRSIVALPYNPYAPNPYIRFTQQNLLDKDEELMIGEEFWDFLGGEKTYEQLIEVFDQVGKEYKTDLHKLIKNVSKKVDAI